MQGELRVVSANWLGRRGSCGSQSDSLDWIVAVCWLPVDKEWLSFESGQENVRYR